MKKRMIITMLALSMVISMTACGGTKEGSTESDASTEEASASDSSSDEIAYEYTPSDYVTLGEYKGIDVEISGDYATDDDAFYAYVDKELASSTGYEKDPDATVVKEDSIVNLNYQGIKDGTPFEGGTAEDQTIDVAGNCSVEGGGYIDGFTSGLPGAKVGETIDCDVTFPDNYGNADLAGAQVIFRFTINYICKPGMTHDNLTDDYVKENLGADSVEAYLKNERELFESEIGSNRENAVKNAMIDKITAGCTVNGYPEDVVESRLDYYIDSYKSYTTDGDVEKYVKENLGVTLDEFKDEMRKEIKGTMESEMVFAAIADAENLTSEESGYDGYIDRCHQAVDLCYENIGEVTAK